MVDIDKVQVVSGEDRNRGRPSKNLEGREF